MNVKVILCCLLFIITASCTSYKKNNVEKIIEYYKEYAYSVCLHKASIKFHKEDENEKSVKEILNIISYRCYEANLTIDERPIRQTLDGLADSIISDENKTKLRTIQDSLIVAEGVSGTTTYCLSCLHFFQSNKLDSVIRIFINDAIENKKRKER